MLSGKAKQKRLLDLLATSKYKIMSECLYYLSRRGWRKKAGIRLSSGYTQYQVTMGGERITFYKHIIVYLNHYGLYPENYTIDHEDRNNLNDNPQNLKAKTHSANVLNSPHSRKSAVPIKRIRGEEISKIRELLLLNLSQSGIAKQLNLNMLSVRYIVNKINNGEVLKYDIAGK